MFAATLWVASSSDDLIDIWTDCVTSAALKRSVWYWRLGHILVLLVAAPLVFAAALRVAGSGDCMISVRIGYDLRSLLFWMLI